MAQRSNAASALALAELGWSVFPLRPRHKAPLTPNGFKDATTDREAISRWWFDQPAAGVGVATGKGSGLLVLDVDPRAAGDDSLVGIEQDHGSLPRTVEALTGGGGRHFYFRHPGLPTASRKGLLEGIDIKSDGGYVVAPYSLHPSGERYLWAPHRDPGDLDLAACPRWLLAQLREATDRVEAAPAPDGPYIEGQRNNVLTSLAGTMRRRGMSPDAILAALLKENERCAPPLAEAEVMRIAASVGRYTPNAEERADKTPKVFVLKSLDVAAEIKKPPPQVDWIVPHRIAVGDVAMLFGPPAAGKSWVTLDLAVTAVTGLPFLGVFDFENDQRVLLVDEENPPDEVVRRLRSLAAAHGITPEELADDLHVLTPKQGFSFRSQQGVRRLHEIVRSFKPTLIVLDSLTAVSTITNEADAVEVRRFFTESVYPLQRLAGAAVLSVHHTSKAAYMFERPVQNVGLARGSIDFIGACDAALLLEPSQKGEHLRLETVKVRRGRTPATALLKIVDGQEGGARPLVFNFGRGEGKPENKKAVAEQVILEQLDRSERGVTGPNLMLFAQAACPTLTEQDIRNALRDLEKSKKISALRDQADRRVAVYRRIFQFASSDHNV